jgi:hypothetical protein
MEKGERPPHVQLEGGQSIEQTEFDTAAHKAAAEAVLTYWDNHHTFTGVAEESKWSEELVRKVFYRYFEPADTAGETGLPEDPMQAYRKGYREGYRDGRADSDE